MPRQTISSQIIDTLAHERRAVAADWRIHIAYMRVAISNGFVLPDETKTKQLINKLRTAHDIKPVNGVSGVYRITVPYASVLPCPDETVIQEANPTAVFSHFTAAQHHNLTYEIPDEFHLTIYRNSSARLPLGTTPEDWVDVAEPRQRTPHRIRDAQIHWHKAKADWDFGHTLGYVQGSPVYITDIERTVIDVLRFPQRCGGATEVLQIWKRAIKSIQLDTVVNYIERFNQTLLKQRAGYILERLGESHVKLDDWAANSVRGSSAKLFANHDFSANHSARWNLSINIPDTILTEQSDD